MKEKKKREKKLKQKKTRLTYIGGQAVMEGVMMRGRRGLATACRDDAGNIQVEAERLKPPEETPKFFRWPFVRGVVSLCSSMVTGTKILMRSAEVYGGEETEEPTAFEKKLAEKYHIDVMSVITGISLVLGVVLAVGLFVFLPYLFSELIATPANIDTKSIWFNLMEGGFRIVIFVAYIALTALMKDIRRTYMYHGAEHKTISCYEMELPLTVENVKKCSRVHDRCGTTFMFLIMVVSILIFSVGNSLIPELSNSVVTFLVRLLVKLALLPVVAGVSYEILRLLAKTQSKWVYPLKAPGLALQMLTTKEPDDDMIECAITAFNKVLEMDADDTVGESSFAVGGKLSDVRKRINTLFARAKIGGEECDWILSLNLGIPVSELDAERLVTAGEARKIFRVVNERLTGRPLWYVIGDTSFCGYLIKVDERVLIPRPETEILVENAVGFIEKKWKGRGMAVRVLDLCTGSGAIAIAVQKLCESKGIRTEVTATDISGDALALARENAEANGADIRFVCSDLFTEIGDGFDVILTNPPYIATGEIDGLQREIREFEPHIALDGGTDGMDFYRRIAREYRAHLAPEGFLLAEVGMGQARKVSALFEENGASCHILYDLTDIERMVMAETGKKT